MSRVTWRDWPARIVRSMATLTDLQVSEALADVGIVHAPEYIRGVRERNNLPPAPPAPGTSLRRVDSGVWAGCGACGECPLCKLLRTYPDAWVLDLGKLADHAIAAAPGCDASVSTVRRERVARGIKGMPVGRPRRPISGG